MQVLGTAAVLATLTADLAWNDPTMSVEDDGVFLRSSTFDVADTASDARSKATRIVTSLSAQREREHSCDDHTDNVHSVTMRKSICCRDKASSEEETRQ